MSHTHKCASKYHEGPRVRTHYDERCTEPYEDSCLECHDLEMTDLGATFEYVDSASFSDADAGL